MALIPYGPEANMMPKMLAKTGLEPSERIIRAWPLFWQPRSEGLGGTRREGATATKARG